MEQSELKMKRPSERSLSWNPLQVSEESQIFRSLRAFRPANEAHVFGVKFIGLYGTVGFIAIRDFSF